MSQTIVGAGSRIKGYLPREDLPIGAGQAGVENQAVGADVLVPAQKGQLPGRQVDLRENISLSFMMGSKFTVWKIQIPPGASRR